MKGIVNSSYHFDSLKISLQHLKIGLQERELIPSRMPLREKIEQTMLLVEQIGIIMFGRLVSARR